MASTTPRKLWLDRLPDDVNKRIVSFLHLADWKTSLEHCMSLAQVSDKQARHVISGMHNSFYLDDVRELPPAKALAWCTAAFPHIKSLWIAESERLEDVLYRQFMLNAPRLYRLYTRPDPAILRSIMHSKTIRRLDISEAFSSISLHGHVGLVMRTLASLNLSELHIDCTIFSPHECITDGSDEINPVFFQRCGLVELLKHVDDPKALGAACPNVTTLSIRCFHKAESFDLVPFLDGFRKLKVFEADFSPMCAETGRRIPDKLVKKLRTLESVHLNYVIDGSTRAGEIGPAMKSLQNAICYRYIMRDEKVLAALSKCTNLEVLRLFLRPGVETAFPGVARKMAGLRALYVAWEIDCRTIVLPDPITGVRHTRRIAEEYYSPAPFTLLCAVQDSPKLKHLELLFVKIRMDEMKSILRSLGTTLNALALSIRGQDETPRDRLTLLLEQIAQTNAELAVFDVEDIEEVTGKISQRGRDRKKWNGCGGDLMSDRRLQVAFHKVRKDVPLLNWKSFAQTVMDNYRLRLIASVKRSASSSRCCHH